MTITVTVPESLVRRLEPLSENEREGWVAAWMLAGSQQDEVEWEITEEDIAAVQRGIDDLEAGRHRPLEEFIAEREAFWNARGMSLENARRGGNKN